MSDTSGVNFAIRLTPPGVGAIAVVRVGGPRTLSFLHKHFTGNPRPGALVHGELRDGEHIIDDPVVVLDSQSRHADIHLHGGQWVTRACLNLAGARGFVVLESSVPLPNFLIDSADVIESEMLEWLPTAATEVAVRALLAQPAAWSKFLERTDVPEIEIRSVCGDRSLHWLLNPPRVAIVGEPNVGKSTVANQLFAQERSITADLAGTTRDWVGEPANLDGLTVTLIDTPGLRETDDPIERAAIAGSAKVIQSADLVLLVLDVTEQRKTVQTHRSGKGASELLSQFPGAIVVLNKVDRLMELPASDDNSIYTVATIGKGIDELRQRVKAYFGVGLVEADIVRARCWTERQRAFVKSRMGGHQP